MKKIISLLLAMIMVFSLATVAFADETTGESGDPTPAPSYSDAQSVTFTKSYKVQAGRNAAQVSPAEEFSFTIKFDNAENVGVDYSEDWAKENLPTVGTVSYNEGEAGKTLVSIVDGKPEQVKVFEKQVEIFLPNYEAVGVYNYTIKEVNNGIAGVTYFPNDIKLVVTVVQGEDGRMRVATIHTEATGAKSDVFENVYASGEVAVKKVVTGNMADQSKYFDFTLTLNSTKPVNAPITVSGGSDDSNPTTIPASAWTNGVATVTFKLKHNDTIVFSNIPDGVTYTVTETVPNDYVKTEEQFEDEDQDGVADAETEAVIGVIDSTREHVTFTNKKETTVDTGIALDSAPYFVILAVALFGVVALVSKKRYEV